MFREDCCLRPRLIGNKDSLLKSSSANEYVQASIRACNGMLVSLTEHPEGAGLHLYTLSSQSGAGWCPGGWETSPKGCSI